MVTTALITPCFSLSPPDRVSLSSSSSALFFPEASRWLTFLWMGLQIDLFRLLPSAVLQKGEEARADNSVLFFNVLRFGLILHVVLSFWYFLVGEMEEISHLTIFHFAEKRADLLIC
jgi:hypothetical protein